MATINDAIYAYIVIPQLTLNEGRLSISKIKAIFPFKKGLCERYKWEYRYIVADANNGYQPKAERKCFDIS